MYRLLPYHIVAFFVCLCCPTVPAQSGSESEPRYYGPILTWDADPTTSMTITWVESTGGASNRAVAAKRWRQGPSGFGYGDDDDATVLEDMQNKYQRVYIRKDFNLEDVADAPAVLQIRYDDAFIAYLNGTEVARREIKSGRGANAKDVGKHESDGEDYSAMEIKNWAKLAQPGRNVLAIEGHNEKTDSSDFTLDVYLDINEDDDDHPLIDKGETWDYFAGADPPDDWMAADYQMQIEDDNLIDWRLGPSGFGYGDEDDATELPDMKGEYTRVYIRKQFKLEQVAEEPAILQVRYDDGFIAYLNGEEITRRRVGSGRGPDIKDVENHDAEKDNFDQIEIENWSKLARQGENVLAIEGHNATIQSSDFTLDAYLESTRDGQRIQVVEKGTTWDYLAGRDPRDGWTKLGFDFQPDSDADVEKLTEVQESDSSKDRDRIANRVFYRQAGEGNWFRVPGSSRFFGNTDDVVRRVRLSGLQANTDYEFLLGGRLPRRTDIRKFRTAAVELGDGVTFVAGGDMSAGKTAQAMNRLVGKLVPMFALLGGDLAYANGKNVSLWHNWLDAWAENAVTQDGRLVPMVVAIGNHETGSKLSDKAASRLGVPRDSQFFFSLFKLPGDRTNYAMDFGDYLSVFVLDSDHTQPVEDQAQWLDKELASHQDSTTRVACYHEPAYGTTKDPNQEIREHWVPLFEKHNISVAFEHDHHSLKRTHRLKGGELDPDGVLYLGDGCWGVKPRDIEDRDKRPYLAHAASKNHLWLVTIKDGKATYRALDEDGEELDRYPE